MVSPGSSGNITPSGPTPGGDLRVLESLGTTAEGRLYEAEYPNGHRVVLLHLHPTAPGGLRSTVERFRLATRIQHPNVAAVFAVGGMEDGSPYAVLEQLDGEPLLQALAERRALGLTEALEICLQIAAGLEAAHRAGFIHGNLSPSSVLVTRAPYGRPQVKLIGFQFDPSHRQLAPLSDQATVGYASPERISGLPVDQRSDVFSLGALLHHLLTGRPPAGDRGVGAIPGIARPVLSKALDSVPDRRYPTMAEFRQALEQLGSAAATPTWWRTLLRPAAKVGVIVLGVGGGFWILWSSLRTRSSEDRPAPVAALGGPASAEPRSTTTAPADARQDSRASGVRSRSPRTVQTRTRRAAVAGSADQRPERNPEPSRVRAPVTAAGSPGRGAQRDTTAEVLGYMGDLPTSPPPTRSPSRGAAPTPRAGTPTPAPTGPVARSREELEQHPGLRHTMGDALRIGLAEDIAEIRPGLLAVYLTPDGMKLPSATYNLQQLYLAYSAATRDQSDVVLELRLHGDVYGRFTREGLIPAAAP
jgi:serine/threonine protein kinase